MKNCIAGRANTSPLLQSRLISNCKPTSIPKHTRVLSRISSMFATLLMLLLLVKPCAAEVKEHRVTALPGYGKLSTRHWSGYLNVSWREGITVHTHYWLVENVARDPKAPLLTWMQGGPGGSSMLGLFTEMGPLTLNDFSFASAAGGVPRVFDTAKSWHKLPANLLFIEHPAPTGLSYCDGGSCKWDDFSQAEVSYKVLKQFFQLYPEFAANPFFMTGESYAGVLVPTLALQILKHTTKENQHLAPWSLKGFALGNACPGNRVYTCTPYSGWIGTKVALDFRFRHGMIPEDLYASILTACDGEWETYAGPKSKRCRELLEDPIRPVKSVAGDTYTMGAGYFLYDTCANDLGINQTTHRRNEHFSEPRTKSKETSTHTSRAAGPPNPNSGEYYCGQERASMAYLNHPEVQDALHVKRQSFQFQSSLEYSYTAHSLVDAYKDVLLKYYNVVQYSGDADPCVPYIGTQRWIKSMGLPVKSRWKPWLAEGGNQIAGYVERYYGPTNATELAFVTLRDAGHMSPRYKPKNAFTLIKTFLLKANQVGFPPSKVRSLE